MVLPPEGMADDCNQTYSLGSNNTSKSLAVVAPYEKTWLELKQAVRTMRRQLSTVSSKIPTFFSFFRVPDEYGQNRTHIYFLSTPPNGREMTLLYVVLPTSNKSSPVLPTLQWQAVLEPNFQNHIPAKQFSREEQLQWERKRLIMWGITSYDFHSESGRFVFPAGGSVFHCGGLSQAPPFYPLELASERIGGARLNPTLCPSNPNLVAFVLNYDIWVFNIHTNQEKRLTFSRKGTEDEAVSSGLPSYVTQEEFNRYIGFWWQPVSSQGCSGVYRILYEEVDESEVEILHLPSYVDDRCMNTVEEFRFPRAGSPNAQSTLKMVTFVLDSSEKIEDITNLTLEVPLNLVYNNYEYLVRAGWTDDGRHIWAQLLNRKQTNLRLVLFSPSEFVPATSANPMTSTGQLLLEETSSVWINVHDVLIFLTQENDLELSFIWASEQTGFRHLYLVTAVLNGDSSMETRTPARKTALTSGSWEVSDKDVWLDHRKGLLYFVGLKDTPLENHLYVVSLDAPEEVVRLTTLNFNHMITIDDECCLVVDTLSNMTVLPQCQVTQIVHRDLSLPRPSPHHVELRPLVHLLDPNPAQQPSHLEGGGGPSIHSEMFQHKLQKGPLVYGMLFTPPNMQPNTKYPIVLTVYGGPEVQLVSNTNRGMRNLRQNLLASQGYVVVMADCRGSRHRGLAFESHIRHRMGMVEIADQVEVLQGIAATRDYMDLSRVAVHGWSYGGYLSLMALVQRPDVFKLAVAGAPVTSWNSYDTGYTERYMDTPENNPQGYINGSVLTYAGQFPDQKNRLLIMHGLMDENVHVTHTMQLVSALIRAGKPYQLQVYPSERHSLRHLEASEHYETTLLSFLQDNL